MEKIKDIKMSENQKMRRLLVDDMLIHVIFCFSYFPDFSQSNSGSTRGSGERAGHDQELEVACATYGYNSTSLFRKCFESSIVLFGKCFCFMLAPRYGTKEETAETGKRRKNKKNEFSSPVDQLDRSWTKMREEDEDLDSEELEEEEWEGEWEEDGVGGFQPWEEWDGLERPRLARMKHGEIFKERVTWGAACARIACGQNHVSRPSLMTV